MLKTVKTDQEPGFNDIVLLLLENNTKECEITIVSPQFEITVGINILKVLLQEDKIC